MAHEFYSFGPLEQSAVREMANIGLGNATTALATLTQKPFKMSVPDSDAVSLEELPSALDRFDDVTVALSMAIDGEADGSLLFVLDWESARTLWNLLLMQAPNAIEEIDELYASTMMEIGNIVMSGFLNAFADMADIKMHASLPRLSIDFAHSIITQVVAEAEYNESRALSVKTTIWCEEEHFEAYFVYIPTIAGLELVFERLGIREAA